MSEPLPELVERLARADYEQRECPGWPGWDECSPVVRESWRRVPREVVRLLPLLTPDDVPQVREAIAREIENGNPREGQYAPDWHSALRRAARIVRGES